jgi:type II secretory pathway component PulK
MIAPLFNRRAASALLLALWCVAVLSITVLSVATLVQRDVEDAGRENRRFEARELALTGIALGMHPKIDAWDPLLNQQFAGGSKLRVRVISEAARLDINRALKEKDQATLRKLFVVWGAEQMEVSEAVDSLIDWIDPNDLRQNNGAEKDDLERSPQYSIPANRDFHSVEEMEKVRGMDRIAALKPNWAEYFTVNGGRRIDLQDASIDVMRAGGLSEEQARQVDLIRRGADKEAQTRDDLKIKNPTEFLKKIGLSDMQIELVQAKFSSGGGPLRIDSRAQVGRVEYRIVVIAAKGGGENSLIAWDE